MSDTNQVTIEGFFPSERPDYSETGDGVLTSEFFLEIPKDDNKQNPMYILCRAVGHCAVCSKKYWRPGIAVIVVGQLQARTVPAGNVLSQELYISLSSVGVCHRVD